MTVFDLFSRIARRLSSFYAKRVGWESIGKRVTIQIEDTPYEKLFGKELVGTIKKTSPLESRKGDAGVELEAPIQIGGQVVREIFVTPRYPTDELSNLTIFSNVVYVAPLTTNQLPVDTGTDLLGMGTIRVKRR